MRVNVRCVFVCLVAFVCCCFACDCVLELVVCRVRFARVSCPRLRFGKPVPVPVSVVSLGGPGSRAPHGVFLRVQILNSAAWNLMRRKRKRRQLLP